ncbi:PREDICTED: proto-oncogene Mas-like [Nanorana parkeri]|uniref:proto-oncogene Mas-like n=1 Tax=Nanorana parkeri TaxID=125878 RepID=UPI0008549F18|nr:PREDICTED: proto-oncogene Mas-like [Nanorana parkeri]
MDDTNITSGNETDVNDTLLQDRRLCTEDHKLQLHAVDAVFLGICVFGLVGNIVVFWNLCFRIPRNKYTVYIANLSAADTLLIAVVALTLVAQISNMFGLSPAQEVACPFYQFVDTFYYSLVYSGKNILTAISVERCISALFPLWYHTHRPKKFSAAACAVLWCLGITEGLLDVFVCAPEAYIYQQPQCVAVEVSIFVSAIGICLPLMVISSVTLLLKVRRANHQEYPPRLYIIIIITVIVFILSVLPLNIFRFLTFFKAVKTEPPIKLIFLSQYWLVFNSTVNPYIYFLVGRNWNQTICCSIRDSLHRAFVVDSEEGDC